MRRTRQNAAEFRPGRLTREEMEARKVLTTQEEVSRLKQSPEYLAFVASKSLRGRTLRAASVLACLALCTAGLCAASLLHIGRSAPTATTPAPEPAAATVWAKLGRLPVLPVGVTDSGVLQDHALAKALPGEADKAVAAIKAQPQAELSAAHSANGRLERERDALQAARAAAEAEAARQTSRVRLLETLVEEAGARAREAEERTRQQAAAAPDSSSRGRLPPLGLAAACTVACGSALLTCLLVALLEVRRGRQRLREQSGALRASLAAEAHSKSQLEAAQQLSARLERQAATSAEQLADRDSAARELQRRLQDVREALAGQQGELRAAREAAAALKRNGAELATANSELHERNRQLAGANRELALAKEAMREELEWATAGRAAAGRAAAPAVTASEGDATPSSLALALAPQTPTSELTLSEPGGGGGADEEEAVVRRVFWPDIELGEELDERTRRGLASIKRRMHRSGHARARRDPVSDPQTPEEYRCGMEELRLRAELLEADNARLTADNQSLEAQVEQVTGSLQAMLRRLDAAQRRGRLQEQAVQELELALAQSQENGSMLAEELGAVRAVAGQCLTLLEHGGSPPPPALVARMRRAIAATAGEDDGAAAGMPSADA